MGHGKVGQSMTTETGRERERGSEEEGDGCTGASYENMPSAQCAPPGYTVHRHSAAQMFSLNIFFAFFLWYKLTQG